MLILTLLAFFLYTVVFALNKLIIILLGYLIELVVESLTWVTKELVKCHNLLPFKKHIRRSVRS